jgi:hypothetical protein
MRKRRIALEVQDTVRAFIIFATVWCIFLRDVAKSLTLRVSWYFDQVLVNILTNFSKDSIKFVMEKLNACEVVLQGEKFAQVKILLFLCVFEYYYSYLTVSTNLKNQQLTNCLTKCFPFWPTFWT